MMYMCYIEHILLVCTVCTATECIFLNQHEHVLHHGLCDSFLEVSCNGSALRTAKQQMLYCAVGPVFGYAAQLAQACWLLGLVVTKRLQQSTWLV
jgi:hypothetical protein